MGAPVMARKHRCNSVTSLIFIISVVTLPFDSVNKSVLPKLGEMIAKNKNKDLKNQTGRT
jgi:hypothetical protein